MDWNENQMKKRSLESRHRYEETWKEEFSARLQALLTERNISVEMAAETVECEPDRIRTLLRGEEYPTVIEILRLVHLTYDAEERLLGRREGVQYLLRG